MAQVINFPVKEREVTVNPCRVSMLMTSHVNGRKVITNLANLSKEDLLFTLLRDAVSSDKEEILRKHISD